MIAVSLPSTRRSRAIVWVNGSVCSAYRVHCQMNAKHDLMRWALIGVPTVRLGRKGLNVFELSWTNTNIVMFLHNTNLQMATS